MTITITPEEVMQQVQTALDEDIGTGDMTAALLPENKQVIATVIAREPAIFCGRNWLSAVYYACDPDVEVEWQVKDGARIDVNQTLCFIKGNARSILTGERTALNFLQALSGTATITDQYVQALAETKCRLLDTRKTFPGLRRAQKYAVSCGGGHNHRLGLYDGVLIKENHISACGSITHAVAKAKSLFPDNVVIEVEVETIDELEEALKAQPTVIMLDNFSIEMMREAVNITAGRVVLEVSGNVDLNNIQTIAATGVDFISVGALTKHVRSIDMSLRIRDTIADAMPS